METETRISESDPKEQDNLRTVVSMEIMKFMKTFKKQLIKVEDKI